MLKREERVTVEILDKSALECDLFIIRPHTQSKSNHNGFNYTHVVFTVYQSVNPFTAMLFLQPTTRFTEQT